MMTAQMKANMAVELRVEDGSWLPATVIRRTAKATSKKYPNFWMVRHEHGDLEVDFDNFEWRRQEAEVFVTMVPRALHARPECVEAKQKDQNLLLHFDAFEEVKWEDMDRKSGDLISYTWVLTEKQVEKKMIIKARLCARGDEESNQVRTDSPTAMKISLRIIFMVSASKGWRMEACDSKSAFLQGSPLDRTVYMTPPGECKKRNKGRIVWKLKKALYGLDDASRSWYLKVDEVLLQLGCKRARGDPSLYMMHKQGRLVGLIGVHVDDFVYTGNTDFYSKIIAQLLKGFCHGRARATGVFVCWMAN